VGNNPAQDFANKGKSAVAKAKPAVNKAKVHTDLCSTTSHSACFVVACGVSYNLNRSLQSSPVSQANVSNPARDFALKVCALLLQSVLLVA
jgi:hypothetical protein